MRQQEFVKVAEILSKSHKIVVKEGSGWAANIEKREVFYRKTDIYNLPEDQILGLLLHEIAHVHYTTNSILPPPKENEELMHTTMNMLEDIAIEHIISGDYPNAGEILKSTETELLDTLVRMLPKMNDVSLHEKALLYGAVRFADRGYAFNLEPYEKLGDEISKIMKSRPKEIYDRKATKDLIPLAKTIVDLLVKGAGQPTPEQKQKMMGEAQDHINAHEETTTGSAKKKVIQNLGGHGWLEGPVGEPKITFVDKIVDQADIIGKKLRTVLKRNNAMEFGGRYRTGKLMTKRFVRVKVMKDRKPFARRIIKSNQSYAFAIASDVSGSMFNGGYSKPGNERIYNGDYALSSMQMVGEALRKAGVPRAMVIFGAKARTVAPMNKMAIRWDQISSQKEIQKAHPGGTDIGAAIKACTNELKKIRAERKIMIILTDGSSSQKEMHEAHKEATTEGIECLGITLGNHHYEMDQVFNTKKNINIQDSEDTAKIGRVFIEILQKTIVNSA